MNSAVDQVALLLHCNAFAPFSLPPINSSVLLLWLKPGNYCTLEDPHSN